MWGTLINAGAVIIGSLVGVLIHSRLPQKITTITFQGIGLFTLFFGVNMASKTNEVLLMIFSLIIGSIIGEAVDVDSCLKKFSEYLKSKIKSENKKFSEGFITAFLLFCMGSMTVLGTFEEGLGGKPNLLLAKSVLDGFSALALAASLGIGVLFSAIPLLIYQGSLTLFASLLQNFFSEMIVAELGAVGGLLLIGLGLNILEIKELKILNMLPSLLIVVILAYFFT